MEIVRSLPVELQIKIKYLVLEHPVAKIIKDEIIRLRCDEYYTFRDQDRKVVCKVRGIDFFCNEYFRRFKDDSSSTSSVDDDLFHSMFDISSTSSDEE